VGTSVPLPDGPRVRLRVLAASDLRELRERLAGETGDLLALERLRRYDPRRRVAISARALIDGSERLVAVGSIAIDDPAPPAPEIVLADEQAAPGVTELLTGVLVARARVLRQARAA
jgi:hypothetical protein